jgi:hypothetical protein
VRAVGFAESGNEPVIGEEVFKLRVPGMFFWSERSFEEDLLDVVIEDLLGNSTKVCKGVNSTWA